MFASRISSIAAKAAFSTTFVASTAYISYLGDQKRTRDRTDAGVDSSSAAAVITTSPATWTTKKTSVNLDQESNVDDPFFFTHDDDQRFSATAIRFLQEARQEIKVSLKELSDSSSIIQNVKVRAIVVDRFLDLMIRSARILVDFKLHDLLHRHDDEGEGDEDNNNNNSRSVIHARAAKSMHDACALHGGILVKLGQYVAANAGGLVPQEYVDALMPLQDACSPLSFQQVEQLINEQLRTHYGYSESSSTTTKSSSDSDSDPPLWKQVFQEIDPIPLGSASLAQVHAATLHDGRRVAIKVQRPNLDVITQADIVALSVLSRAVEFAFPGTGFDWILPEFYKTVTAELDFCQEAANAERCQRMLRGCSLATNTSLMTFLDTNARALLNLQPIMPPTVIIPTPIRELTTPKMLTMTYEEGFRITDVKKLNEHGIDPKKVAAASCVLFAELMFVHGFCYADCHPGNVFVRPRCYPANGEFDLVLLDHGMYRRLDERFRAGYCNLWAGLVSGNDNQARRGLRSLGLQDKHLDIMGLWLTYRIPFGVVSESPWIRGNKLGTVVGKGTRGKVKHYLKEKFGEDEVSAAGINKFIASQSRDLLFCLRCTNLVRGINRELGGTTVDRFLAFGAAASRGAHLDSALLSQQPADTADVTNVLKTPMKRILEQVKASLNMPVASELRVLEQQQAEQNNGISSTVSTRAVFVLTFRDYLEAYKLTLRTWLRGFFLDVVIFLSGAVTDLSLQNLG